jgi:tetratricopeptide (TPR) repeat protein
VGSLKHAWDATRFDVPLDFGQAQAKGYQLLQSGQFAEALRCYRVCDAIDPNNAVTLRNIGFLYCQLGMTFEAVAYSSEGDAKAGPMGVATTLHQGKKLREAVLVYRYATLGSNDPQSFAYFAQAAYALEDDENAALAYGRLFAVTRGAGMDNATLNAYAGVLDNIGDAKACEAIGRRLIEVAKGDPTFTSCGLHHVACGLLGQGRAAEAVQPAQQALQMNPLPDNTAVFTETLQRAQGNQPREVKPLASHSPDAKAFDALATGDFQTPQQLAQSAQSWKTLRAALVACAFRDEANNAVAVMPAAKDAARWVLQSSAGALDPDAIFARMQALKIREDAAFSADPPPVMGTRMPREQFEQRFAATAGPPSAPMGAPGGPGAAASGDPDPVVFPGSKLAKLSDYVGLMKAMQGGNPMAAMSKFGLDMKSFGPLAAQWGQKLGSDPALAQKFQQMMSR